MGLHLTVVSVEVTAPPLHPPLPQDHRYPQLLGTSLVSPPQREAALCQAEVEPMLPTTPREVPARALALDLQALVDQHPHLPLLLLPLPHPAPLPHMDMQYLIPIHSPTRCLMPAGLLMVVSV